LWRAFLLAEDENEEAVSRGDEVVGDAAFWVQLRNVYGRRRRKAAAARRREAACVNRERLLDTAVRLLEVPSRTGEAGAGKLVTVGHAAARTQKS